MSINTRLEGFEELNTQLFDLIHAADETVERVSNFVAQSTAQRAKNLIRNSVPAGDVHFRDNPDRYVRASAPGQPPAIDLGNLIESINFKKFQTGSAHAYASAYYASDLELGTDRIAPRPFMTPAMELALEAAEKQFAVEWGRLT